MICKSQDRLYSWHSRKSKNRAWIFTRYREQESYPDLFSYLPHLINHPDFFFTVFESQRNCFSDQIPNVTRERIAFFLTLISIFDRIHLDFHFRSDFIQEIFDHFCAGHKICCRVWLCANFLSRMSRISFGMDYYRQCIYTPWDTRMSASSAVNWCWAGLLVPRQVLSRACLFLHGCWSGSATGAVAG